jgi:hypothetical protein
MVDVELAEPVATAGGHGAGAIQKPLQGKQANASTTNAPVHVSSIDQADALAVRSDATITFVTSLAANQPVAQAFDRVRAYERAPGDTNVKKFRQFLEVEGRALPASAYALSYLRHLLEHGHVPPGNDAALVNAAAPAFALYNFAGYFGMRKSVRIENVMKASSAYTGVGGVTTYAVNDGTGGLDRSSTKEKVLGPYWVARAYGANISSLYASKVKAFFLMATADINAGFTIKVGGRAYVTEEINDIEDKIFQFLKSINGSLTGTFGAAVRGNTPPQDPFTGASTFLFGDIVGEAQDLSIIIGTPQAVQIVVITEAGIDSLST